MADHMKGKLLRCYKNETGQDGIGTRREGTRQDRTVWNSIGQAKDGMVQNRTE